MKIVFGVNEDKPHRCPRCYTITDSEQRADWGIVRCCWCSTLFTRRPQIARLLPYRGIVCTQPHSHPDALRAADRLAVADSLLRRLASLYDDVGHVASLSDSDFEEWDARKEQWRKEYAAYIEVNAHSILNP